MEVLGFLFIIAVLAAIIFSSNGNLIGIAVSVLAVVILLAIIVSKRKSSAKEEEPGDGEQTE
ncbi:MAG: hypothetical protein ACI4OU_05830 [Candidatus Enterenecus sp.]